MRSVRQKLDEWKQAASDIRADMELAGLVPSEARMKHLIDLLGDVLPFYKLLHVQFGWRHQLYANEQLFGCTSYGHEPNSPDFWILIEMDPADLHVHSKNPDHFTCIMSTLLHECIHAFLRSYACKPDCARADCRPYEERMGGSGHGSAFVIISTYVEACAEDFLVDSQLRLGVVDSMLEEADDSGIVPSEAEIGMCHPEYKKALEREVENVIAGRSSEGESEYESELESELGGEDEDTARE